jgi:hypothetical protein
MTRVIDIQRSLYATSQDCLKHGKWLSKNHPTIWDCFAVLDKNAALANDILEGFKEIILPIEVGLFSKQIGERIKMVLRSAFIFSFSIVEYSMKRSIGDLKRGKLYSWYIAKLESKKRVYLRSVVERSKKLGLINEVQEKSWSSLNTLRNILVHNNGYADENDFMRIGQLEMQIVAGKSVKINWINYVMFLQTIVTLYRRWIESVIQDAMHR